MLKLNHTKCIKIILQKNSQQYMDMYNSIFTPLLLRQVIIMIILFRSRYQIYYNYKIVKQNKEYTYFSERLSHIICYAFLFNIILKI